MKMERILGVALLTASLALVGCGGGGGGGSSSAKSTEDVAAVDTTPVEDTGALGEVDETGPVDPELLLPVDDGDDNGALALVNDDPGQIAANPEPATAALAAVGLAFLATRRYGRRA